MTDRSVLVAGATGRQGGTVVNHLLSGEYGEFDVHALTRSPESDRAQFLSDQGASVAQGDLLTKESLTPLVEGVEAVYCVTTFGEGDFEGEVKQGINMAEVAADGGVDHFLFSSVAGADRDTGIQHIESKSEIEGRIRELDLPTTIIRLRFFMQNFESQRGAILNGTLSMPMTKGASRQMLHLEDVGMFAATVFARPAEFLNEVIELGGDEHTLESAAEVFTAVTGATVTPEYVPVEVARKGLINSAGEIVGEDLVRMFEWHNTHDLNNNIESVERDYGGFPHLT
ncbi:NmrA/HSCARG family protein [Haladaptatus pallidirubidus]|uniref:NmrA/HSCARG family protein n=1 Tax=Haladaptatus pallidirubidus TaxID=1008152 RepID=A0AAV3UPU7_9EURY|nr:NmrA/HSCARG family protein [Haladaptatus pallidirubidus]